AKLLRSALRLLDEVAAGWVEAGCKAKHLPLGEALEGEEWFAGPIPTARNLRLVADSLEATAKKGQPPLGRGARTRPDGRVEIDVFPTSGWDANLYRGMACSVLMLPG